MPKKIVGAEEPNHSGTIFYKLLTCADGIDIIGFNNSAVSSVCAKLDKEPRRMDLVVNDDKTKYLLP